MILKAGFIGLSLLMAFLIVNEGFVVIDKTFGLGPKSQKKKRLLILGLIVWLAYNYFMGSSGVLRTFELPPRFVLFIIFPAFLFTGIFIYQNRNNKWVQNLNPKNLTYLQSFRILVETLFVYAVAANVLHENVTIEGYNFDMIFGFSAPIVAFLVFRTRPYLTNWLKLWNYLGLVVLASVIFVFFTTIYFPGLYGSADRLMPLEFTEFPYIMVAGFLMPLAVFMHILSIVHLNKTREPN